MQTSFAMDDVKIEDLKALYLHHPEIRAFKDLPPPPCYCSYNKQDFQGEALVSYHLVQTTQQIRETIRRERAQCAHPSALGPVSTTIVPITAATIAARQKEKKPEPIPLRLRRLEKNEPTTEQAHQTSTTATNTLLPTAAPQPAPASINDAKPAADKTPLPPVPPAHSRRAPPAPERLTRSSSRKRPLPSPTDD